MPSRKSAANILQSLPSTAVTEMPLMICLKCAFDVCTKQFNLATRTAYVELRKHVPEETDFTGASTVRPHFLAESRLDRCPFCNAPKRWFAGFHAYRIEAHPSFEKERKRTWTALKKLSTRFTLWKPDLTQMQIFSRWLEWTRRHLDMNGDAWLLAVAVSWVKRCFPSNEWDEVPTDQIRRVQVSRQVENGWTYEERVLYVSPVVYGDVLMVQHLLSRAQMHGGTTFEGRLTLRELEHRLRRLGYFEARGIDASEPQEIFEQAVAALVASGPDAVYYAVDRGEYLEKLKSVYEKKAAGK